MKKTIILLSLVLLCACGNRVLIDETHQFDNGVWMRFEPAEFKVDVKDIEPSYNVCVTLRYDTSRYREDVLPLVVDFFPDSNELHNFTPIVRLRNRDGSMRGEVISNYCTVTDTIDRHRLYNREGTYTYRIRQRTSKYEIYGFNSVSFKVTKD